MERVDQDDEDREAEATASPSQAGEEHGCPRRSNTEVDLKMRLKGRHGKRLQASPGPTNSSDGFPMSFNVHQFIKKGSLTSVADLERELHDCKSFEADLNHGLGFRTSSQNITKGLS